MSPKQRMSKVLIQFAVAIASACQMAAICLGQSRTYPAVTNLASLESLVNGPWTNSLNMIPPGDIHYFTDLGVFVYPDNFEPAFMASLSPMTNANVEMYPVSVVETNTVPRQRIYYNASGLTAYTSTVSLTGYPSNTIVAAYGAIPTFITGSNVTQWLTERDPNRQKVLFSLINQSNVNAYYTALTNAFNITVDETNTMSLLDVYSNDIAFVKTGVRADGMFEYYLHAPTNIPLLSLYISTNLLSPLGGWCMPSTLNHSSDPLYGIYAGTTNTPIFFAVGNPAIDSDGDGLSDSLERWVLGTDPNNPDSDGDGLPDGTEVNRWGTNPNSVDSDGDLFPDAWEIANGYNPDATNSWSFKDGALIITSPVGQWDWSYLCNTITYNGSIASINTPVIKPIGGVVWSDAITSVLLIVGDKNGKCLRRFNAPVINRQFSCNISLFPGDNKIRAYAGYEASNVFYYMGTDVLLMKLSVDSLSTSALAMQFASTIETNIAKRPIFDVVIQQRTYSKFSTPYSWSMQRASYDSYPTASWAYQYGTWDGSTRSLNITPYSGMIRVDVHDVSQDHTTHNNTLRVLLNGSVVSEEIRTGLSNYVTNDVRQYDTAMKGGVWVCHSGSSPGGFSVNSSNIIELLPQMTLAGYNYQPPINGASYSEVGRVSNGIYGTDTTYPVSWYGMTNMNLTGPAGTSPVYLKYGESAQFHAIGTVMLNAPSNGITTNFPGLNIVNCFTNTDEYGVFNGNTPGTTKVFCAGANTTVDVYVAKSPIALNIRAAMDGNQDRVIDFSNTNDSRCLFWINDDHDTIHQESFTFLEDDTDSWSSGAHQRNCDDNTIGARGRQGGRDPSPTDNNCRRDLEDFTVLQLQVPYAVTNLTGVTYWLKIVPESGSPVINVFRAITNGVTSPFDYLTKTNVADLQIKETKLYEIGAAEQQINSSDIVPGQTISYLIEGKETGKGDLTFILKKDNVAWTSDKVKLDLHTISDFYDIYQCGQVNATNGPKWEADVSGSCSQIQTNSAYAIDPSKYLLFVHGWNMEEKEKRWFAETAFKRLWWQGYKGGFGLFDWPTLYGCNLSAIIRGPIKLLHNYDDSEMLAWLSSTALARLMETLNGSGQLRVLAHSMGNVVMGEGLRKYQGAQKVYCYIASQAAISGSMYGTNSPPADFSPIVGITFGPDTPDIYSHWFSGDAGSSDMPYLMGNTSKVTRLCNYFNTLDFALNWWEINNKMKPDDAWGYRFAYGGLTNVYDETAPATNRFYRSVSPVEGFDITTTNLQTRYAVFAYDAESRSRALGRAFQPMFTRTNVDLHYAYQYDDTHYSHSKEFRSNIIEQWGYYGSVIRDAGQ